MIKLNQEVQLLQAALMTVTEVEIHCKNFIEMSRLIDLSLQLK